MGDEGRTGVFVLFAKIWLKYLSLPFNVISEHNKKPSPSPFPVFFFRFYRKGTVAVSGAWSAPDNGCKGWLYVRKTDSGQQTADWFSLHLFCGSTSPFCVSNISFSSFLMTPNSPFFVCEIKQSNLRVMRDKRGRPSVDRLHFDRRRSWTWTHPQNPAPPAAAVAAVLWSCELN